MFSAWDKGQQEFLASHLCARGTVQDSLYFSTSHGRVYQISSNSLQFGGAQVFNHCCSSVCHSCIFSLHFRNTTNIGPKSCFAGHATSLIWNEVMHGKMMQELIICLQSVPIWKFLSTYKIFLRVKISKFPIKSHIMQLREGSKTVHIFDFFFANPVSAPTALQYYQEHK